MELTTWLELFGSDFTLIGAVLAGLAITLLGIVRDLSRFRLDPAYAPAALIR
jgi:hypothetical protein